MREKLPEMRYEEKGVVKMIEGGLQERVAGMGIRVGKEIKMLTKQPMKGPVVVIVDDTRTSLGLKIAEKIIVEVKK